MVEFRHVLGSSERLLDTLDDGRDEIVVIDVERTLDLGFGLAIEIESLFLDGPDPSRGLV